MRCRLNALWNAGRRALLCGLMAAVAGPGLAQSPAFQQPPAPGLAPFLVDDGAGETVVISGGGAEPFSWLPRHGLISQPPPETYPYAPGEPVGFHWKRQLFLNGQQVSEVNGLIGPEFLRRTVQNGGAQRLRPPPGVSAPYTGLVPSARPYQ